MSQLEGAWSSPYEIAPPLLVDTPKTKADFPQVEKTASIVWTAKATGGVGDLSYGFELERDGDVLPLIASNNNDRWTWTPEEAGDYRVRAVVTDALGHMVQGEWSDPFTIAPALVVETPTADKTFPQAALGAPIVWSVTAVGGVGELYYGFELEKDGKAFSLTDMTSLNSLLWTPEKPGNYRIRAEAADSLGNKAAGEWSQPFTIAPPLTIVTFSADKPAPQVAATVPVIWTAAATGGVGGRTFTFELEKDGEQSQSVQTGPDPTWNWTPKQAGDYRARITIEDSLGNRAEGEWSEPYQIAPPLMIEGLTADKHFPQAALSATITWTATASGGFGELKQSFELEKDGIHLPIISAGSLGPWSWTPEEPGTYRIRAVMSDSLGNSAKGDWTQPCEIAPKLSIASLSPDRTAPQAARTVPIVWQVAATGGVGVRTFTFEFQQDGQEPRAVQTGAETLWEWRPELAGDYRVRALIEDSLGNTVEGDWSEWYEIAPPLTVGGMTADRAFPQVARTEAIEWSAKAEGGVGALRYAIEFEKDKQLLPILHMESTGPWSWRPEQAGDYRIRAVVTDALGNRTTGEWSEPFTIAPPLEVKSLTADRSFPQTALGAAIAWTVTAGGGVGELSQSFELERDGKQLPLIATGLLGVWLWTPEEPGIYRIRAVVTDSLGNKTAGAWSEPYEIAPPLVIESLAFDKHNPQAAQTLPITLTAAASGGVGAKTYLFQLSRDGEIEQFAQEGPDSHWLWRPETEGQYRIRVVASDALGNQVESEWSDAYEILPALEVSAPKPNNPLSQYLIQSRIEWRVQSSGGVGKKKYAFTLEKKNGEKSMTPSDSADVWIWQPKEPGFYRVQVSAVDARGNQQESGWSDWKEVRLPLSFNSLTTTTPSPRQALQGAIHWSAETGGGVGIVTYEFRSTMQGIESVEQRSASSKLEWQPRRAGSYRIKVRAWDDEHNVVESEWSEEYRITPAVTSSTRVAFLPVVNLADVKAPMQQIGRLFSDLLKSKLQVLPEGPLEEFMQKHRMRYTGGINTSLAQALLDETGVEAVFITALETWAEGTSPRISLISRLVTTGDAPEIVWIDSVGLTGDDNPGLLGLGRTDNVEQLLKMALQRLTASFQNYLDGNDPCYRHVADQKGVRLINDDHDPADGVPDTIKRKHQPRFTYRASTFDPSGQYKIAVIPFMNINARKYAGEIVALHTVKQLHRYTNIRVFEPGLIRETLLNYRMIMRSGPSLAAADVLSDAGILGADLVASGKVFDYQGDLGRSKVDFSLQVFDGVKREVLWTSRSSATGNQGVYLFDWGKVPSAHGLVCRMTRAMIQQLEEEK